jgi:hypothetical protein
MERSIPWVKVKPACGWAKVNVDAAIDKGAGRMGVGIILRDHEGNFIAAKSAMQMGLWDSASAEALTAYFGVLLGRGC